MKYGFYSAEWDPKIHGAALPMGEGYYMSYPLLSCTSLSCPILSYPILSCPAVPHLVLPCAVLYSTFAPLLLHCKLTVLHCTILYFSLLNSTLLYSMALYRLVLTCTVLNCPTLDLVLLCPDLPYPSLSCSSFSYPIPSRPVNIIPYSCPFSFDLIILSCISVSLYTLPHVHSVHFIKLTAVLLGR